MLHDVTKNQSYKNINNLHYMIYAHIQTIFTSTTHNVHKNNYFLLQGLKIHFIIRLIHYCIKSNGMDVMYLLCYALM